MTIASATNYSQYAGDGATTAFAFTFVYYAQADVQVIQESSAGADTIKVLTADYTITNGTATATNGFSGGTVNMLTAPPTGTLLTIRRAPAKIQPSVYSNVSSINLPSYEADQDAPITMIQDLQDQLNRVPMLTAGVSRTNFPSLPMPFPVASTVWGWSGSTTAPVPALYAVSSVTSITAPVVIGGTDQGKVAQVNSGSTGYASGTLIPSAMTLSGGTTAYTLSINPWSSAYDNGNVLFIRMPSTCAATPTLNITPNGASALGAKNLVYEKYDGTFVNLAAGDLLSANDYVVKYDATADKFIVLAPVVPSAFNAQFDNRNSGQNVISSRVNHITGLVLTASAGTTTLTIGAGTAMDSTGVQLITLGAFTKLLDATGTWTSGTGGKGNQAASAATTSYHIFLIGKTTDLTAADIFFDTSVTAANLAASAAGSAGFNVFRRIGSLNSDGSKNWVVTRSYELGGGGLRFELDVVVRNFSTNNPGTSAVTWTTSIPTGVKFVTECGFKLINTTTARNALVTSLDQTDTAPTNSINTLGVAAATQQSNVTTRRVTSTSATLRYRLDSSDANVTAEGYTIGWEDSRR